MQYKIIPVTPYQQNCSLIWCEQSNKAALVDPGGEPDRILQVVAAEQVELEKIILTHGHIDHVGAVAKLAERLGLPIEGPHVADNFWIEMLPQQSQMMNFPPVDSFVPQRWLSDGDTVTVGEQQLSVLHCPGHTPGHVVFYHQSSELAWVGDVLFNGSIGRSDFPKGDHNTLINSIRNKLFALGDQVSFVPGHGPMSTFGHERKTNPFVADSRFG